MIYCFNTSDSCLQVNISTLVKISLCNLFSILTSTHLEKKMRKNKTSIIDDISRNVLRKIKIQERTIKQLCHELKKNRMKIKRNMFYFQCNRKLHRVL